MHNLITAALFAVLLTTAIGVVYLVIDSQGLRTTVDRLTRPAWALLGKAAAHVSHGLMRCFASRGNKRWARSRMRSRVFLLGDALEGAYLSSHRIGVALGFVDYRCADAADRTYWDLSVDCNGHRCGSCDTCVEYGRERTVGVCR